MDEVWRVVDTGLREAAQNIALDRALLEARCAEEIPTTLRFYRCAPCVLIASRASAAHEADLEHCSAAGIAVQRRITGGETMYCDGAHLAFALYLNRREAGTSDMQAVARRICHAIAAALDALGAPARYRPQHDIVVNSRRIGSGGGVFEDTALLYQGVLHLTLDSTALLRALRTPGVALGEQARAAADARVTDLSTVLGRATDPALVRDRVIAALESEFAVEFHEGDLSLSEQARYRHALEEIDMPGWVEHVQRPAAELIALTTQPPARGALGVSVLYDSAPQRIKDLWFVRGGSVIPAAIVNLEAVLRDTAVARLERNVQSFFSAHADVRAVTAAEVISVLRRVLPQPLVIVSYPGEPRS